jgi:hypothetical protein
LFTAPRFSGKKFKWESKKCTFKDTYTPSLCRTVQDQPPYNYSFLPYEFPPKLVVKFMKVFHAAFSTSLSWCSNFKYCVNSLIWDPTIPLLELIIREPYFSNTQIQRYCDSSPWKNSLWVSVWCASQVNKLF